MPVNWKSFFFNFDLSCVCCTLTLKATLFHLSPSSSWIGCPLSYLCWSELYFTREKLKSSCCLAKYLSVSDRKVALSLRHKLMLGLGKKPEVQRSQTSSFRPCLSSGWLCAFSLSVTSRSPNFSISCINYVMSRSQNSSIFIASKYFNSFDTFSVCPTHISMMLHLCCILQMVTNGQTNIKSRMACSLIIDHQSSCLWGSLR